jgi:hypothetical protein
VTDTGESSGMDENGILGLVRADPWMMRVLQAAAGIDLPDWMIGAGFLRNKVWDHLHGYVHAEVRTADIDLIYFDPLDLREEQEKRYDAQLRALCDVNWSAKNQARMHHAKGHPPYTSAADGLAHWVETAAAVAVTLRGGSLALIAPHGIYDLVGLILRPTPAFRKNTEVLMQRAAAKKWLETWPELKIVLE